MVGKLLKLAACLALLIGVAASVSATVPDNLAAPRSYRSARISSYDKTGGNNDGTQASQIQPGETRTIAEINGPGNIAHIWITTFGPAELDLLRDVIVRIYWDGEKTPSVEAPLGEFFGLGHGRYYTYESLPLAIGNNKGLNCFFPMPFKKSARITVQNLGKSAISDFYYYVDYQIFKAPRNDLLYFHAQYRQAKPILSPENYTILQASGRGHYVGCFLYVRANEPGWWGEGDDMIYIDGDKEPTLHGTGAEDYFCHSWGFAVNTSTMRFGAPLSQEHWEEGGEYSVYRFHIEDAIAFTKSIRVTIEHAYGGTNDRSDDYSSVAYWYQAEPHAPFPVLPSPSERRPTADRLKALLDAKRFDDYRKVQTQIKDEAGTTWVKRSAAFNIADSYAIEGNTAKAIEEFRKQLAASPGRGWNEKIAARLKELGAE